MSRIQDILGCMKGLQLVISAGLKVQERQLKQIYRNSSLKNVSSCMNKASDRLKVNNQNTNVPILQSISESGDRFSTVIDGVLEFVAHSVKDKDGTEEPSHKHSDKQTQSPSAKKVDFEIKLTEGDKELLRRLDMEHKEKLNAAIQKAMDKKKIVEEKPKPKVESKEPERPKVEKEAEKPKVSTRKHKDSLPSSSKERSVPASRIGRLVSFGSLAAGIGVGTATEYVKRAVGLEKQSRSPLFLTRANMDRIVDTLCKVRGAALKLGQLLSIQDESVISPELAEALQRVRRSADFMPKWQLEEVMITQLGEKWRDNFIEFNDKPFAAASIGQVHWARTIDKQDVAIKVQYPGVAKGINSDIDNLVGIMNLWNIFPKGMFIENVVVVAKRELGWEVDYIREAECTRKFRELLKPYKEYYVPKVIDHLCTAEVFTSEFIEGVPIEQCLDLDVDERSYIATKLLELVLIELMVLRYMQTDPNWANFFYNKKTKQIMLLDFGASREYNKKFVDKYVQIIKAASEKDRKTVLEVSRELGMLTGYESKIMEEAHIDAVMILGEVFQSSNNYSFKGREMVTRIQQLVPTMIDHRLTPPPEEIYSLHRKLSGIFLLCAKLDAPISARNMFLDMYSKYKFDS